jgi:murein L,D-transpeptidase YafK
MTGALLMLVMGAGGDRVQDAYVRAGDTVRKMCVEAKLAYPPKRLFIRAFKTERELEVWGADSATQACKLIRTYPIAGMSGTVGPKRKEGDLQVPEGFYFINRFNPQSRFLLSLGLNYPNASDLILSDKERPGGDIFIHGSNVSIGCLAMTDQKIEQIYVLALEARNAGQKQIPVHIFPFRMSQAKLEANTDSGHRAFWLSLKTVYDKFEKTKLVPAVKVDSEGRYRLR